MSQRNKRSGLGRGLDALLPKAGKSSSVPSEDIPSDKVSRDIVYVELSQLHVSPYQPRKRLDPAAIAELASSIADKGILQPLLVRPLPKDKDSDVISIESAKDRYEIVAGERRYRAAEQVGLTQVPAIIKALDDQATLEIAIIENLQREALTAVETARAFKQLMDFGMNQEQVAKAVGKSRSAVANTLRLLHLSNAALEALDEGIISAGHARAILAQPEEDRSWALQQIMANQLSVRDAEKLVRTTKSITPKAQSDDIYHQLAENLTRHMGTRVKIRGKEKGRLELHFHSTEELERLLELLGYQS